MTQLNQVRGQLLLKGNITSWDAIQKFRITRIGEYISQLRHSEHMDIVTVYRRKNDKNYGHYMTRKYYDKNYKNSGLTVKFD